MATVVPRSRSYCPLNVPFGAVNYGARLGRGQESRDLDLSYRISVGQRVVGVVIECTQKAASTQRGRPDAGRRTNFHRIVSIGDTPTYLSIDVRPHHIYIHSGRGSACRGGHLSPPSCTLVHASLPWLAPDC